MIRTESSGGWQNHDCSIALPYVCKKKPNATAEPIQPGEPGHKGPQGHGAVQPFWPYSPKATLILSTNYSASLEKNGTCHSSLGEYALGTV